MIGYRTSSAGPTIRWKEFDGETAPRGRRGCLWGFLFLDFFFNQAKMTGKMPFPPIGWEGFYGGTGILPVIPL